MDDRDDPTDPIAQFVAWFDRDDAAVCVATAEADGAPDARMVLLKDVDERGFTFYTNESSAKGSQLAVNPRAALVWHRSPLQVRVRGSVEMVSDLECDDYWVTRPRGSQLGAWASSQSTVIASRAALEQRLAEMSARFDGHPVPRPPYWRGYRVVPDEIELWHHRDDRLHDRVLYTREADGTWRRERLSP